MSYVPTIFLLVAIGALPARKSPDDGVIVRAVADSVRTWEDSVARALPPWTSWGVEPRELTATRDAKRAGWLRTLGHTDQSRLLNSSDSLLHLGLREGLERRLATSVCADELWNVSPMGGPHLSLARSLGTRARDSTAALETLVRLHEFPLAMRYHLSNLEAGLARGLTSSQDNVARVIEQLNIIATQITAAGSEQPYLQSLSELAPSFTNDAATTIADSVVRALSTYRVFLEDRYRARARTASSLASQPSGTACYRARLRLITGTDLEPDSLLAIAISQRAAVDSELAPILERLVGRVRLGEAKRQMRTEPRFLFKMRDEMLEDARSVEARLTPAIAKLFRSAPDVPLIVAPTPSFLEASDPPARYGAPERPGAPGTFFLNTWHPDSQPRWNLPMAVAHEGSPGHHLQQTYARSLPLPDAARSFGTGSYIEGWGMYAEELAARESGVLSDDLSRAGFLMHFSDAWLGLELDIRMHAYGMTREQLMEAMVTLSGRSPTVASVYADRHASTPGQIASYMTGYQSIRSMRSAAERNLGRRFDVRDFHQLFLESGPLPLSIVANRVEVWAATHK